MASPLSEVRREAEEALRRVLANAAAIVRLSWSDGATPSDRANLERIKSAAADIAQDHKILRALLASEPARRAAEAEALIRMAYDARFGGTAWQRRAHAYLWDAPPDAAEPAKGAKRCTGECPDCHGAGLYGVTDENGDQDTVICRHPAPPAGAEVREALAEIVEWSAREAPCACDVDSPVECWLCRWHSRATATLAARPAVVDGAEVREAAEAVLAEAREALDEIRRRSTDKLAGGIAASFLGAHPRAALRDAQKGGE